MAILKVLNPVAESEGKRKPFQLASRPSTFEGKTVGLLWNDKRGGDVALKHVGQLLQAQFRDVKVRFYKGPRGYPDDLLIKAFQECDIFLGSTGD